MGKRSCHEITHLDVCFGATLENCVPFSLLNVLGASKSQAKRLRKALKTICGMSILAVVSGVALGVRLKCWPGKTLAWLLQQKDGRFLLLQGVHWLIPPPRCSIVVAFSFLYLKPVVTVMLSFV